VVLEPGLGQEFAVEVHLPVNRAVAYPRAWMVLEGEVRRALVRRFPYGVLSSCACSNHNLNRWVQKHNPLLISIIPLVILFCHQWRQ